MGFVDLLLIVASTPALQRKQKPPVGNFHGSEPP